jgi:hypothetical protein
MKEYLSVTFESSSSKTPQFMAFAKAYRKELERKLPADLCITTFNTGHFYVSGFITRKECRGCVPAVLRNCSGMLNKVANGCKPPYVYFSCSDVRYFKNQWYENILIRSAKDEEDFTGGPNGNTTLEEFGRNVEWIIKRQMNRGVI